MSNFIGMGWTDTRIDTLKQLAADGLSAREIGMEMGVTRNAVIGKLGRLGVQLKGLPTHPGVRRRREDGPPKPKKIRMYRGPWPPIRITEPEIVPDFEAQDLPPDQSEFACTIVELGADMCRWVMGDKPADWHYCGAPSVGSWCSRHRRIVFTRPERRER